MNEISLTETDAVIRQFYPDLIEQGGVVGALQGALRRAGSSLEVAGFDGELAQLTNWASVSLASRSSQVFIAATQRLFLFDFWSRGVMLGRGGTPELDNAAHAIDRWNGTTCGMDEMMSLFNFVKATDDAWAYEQGVEVEQRWREYLEEIPGRFPELTAVVTAAAARPALRQLFPFTSLNVLHFSRCTGYPFTDDTPYVVPVGDGLYEIRKKGKEIGRGDAETAIRLVIDHLPPGCGPAVAGTAKDMGIWPPRHWPDSAGAGETPA